MERTSAKANEDISGRQVGRVRQPVATCGATAASPGSMHQHNALDVQCGLIHAARAAVGIVVQAPPSDGRGLLGAIESEPLQAHLSIFAFGKNRSRTKLTKLTWKLHLIHHKSRLLSAILWTGGLHTHIFAIFRIDYTLYTVTPKLHIVPPNDAHCTPNMTHIVPQWKLGVM